MVVVSEGADAADDWIAEHVGAGDVVITADIPLAARCLAAEARVIGTNGRPFTDDSIGSALAVRDLKSQLRDSGVNSGGPRPIAAKIGRASSRSSTRFFSGPRASASRTSPSIQIGNLQIVRKDRHIPLFCEIRQAANVVKVAVRQDDCRRRRAPNRSLPLSQLTS